MIEVTLETLKRLASGGKGRVSVSGYENPYSNKMYWSCSIYRTEEGSTVSVEGEAETIEEAVAQAQDKLNKIIKHGVAEIVAPRVIEHRVEERHVLDDEVPF